MAKPATEQSREPERRSRADLKWTNFRRRLVTADVRWEKFMGWTLGLVETFSFNGINQSDMVHAEGNNLAWNCNRCKRAVLFVYRGGRPGSSRQNSTECRGCGTRYHLAPEYTSPELGRESLPPGRDVEIFAI